MTSLPKTFRSSFWETDFVSQVGFETLVAHMKEGQKSCKWLEDFLKQRAKAEEDYSKTLLKISKYVWFWYVAARHSQVIFTNKSDLSKMLWLRC